MALTLDGDNGISGINGSAATPAVQGTDTNTGLTFGTDTVGIVTGGTTRATVDSSGRLLVGTSTARSDFFNTTTIGPPLQIEGTSNNTAALSVVWNSNSADSSKLYLCKTRGTAVGGTTVVQVNDDIGSINFQASDGSELVQAAAITGSVDGTPGSNDMPGRLTFSTTADGASSPTERMRIQNDGKVFIHTTSTNKAADGFRVESGVPNTSRGSSGSFYEFYDSSSGSRIGYISNSGGTTTVYNTSSDYRLKENVVPLTGAVDRLNQLQVRRFNFIATPNLTVDGFIAHEAQAVVPEAVTGTQDEVEVWKEGEELPEGISVGDNKLDEDGNTIPVYQGIDQSKLVPLLTAALQEALAKIETLETRLTALEGGAA